MTETETALRDRLKDAVRAHKNEELESIWLAEVVEAERQSDDFHQSIIRFLLNKKEEEKVESLYSVLAEQRLANGEAARALQLIGFLLESDPTMDFLRPLLVKTLKALYAEHGDERLEEYLRISGIHSESPDLDRAFARFDELVGAARGQVFKHGQWGLGVVVELDPKAEWAVLDFPRKKGHRMTLSGIRDFLRRIPRDHILAKIATDPDGYRAEAKQDPAGVVRLALKSQGPKLKVADLKILFINSGLFNADEYKRWWAKAKDALRVDPHIEVAGKGANITLTLRDTPKTFVDEVINDMMTAESVAERRGILREVVKHAAGAEVTEEDKVALHGLFCRPVEAGILKTEADRLGHGALFEECAATAFPKDASNPIDLDAEIAAAGAKAADAIVEVGVAELQRLLIERMMASGDEQIAQRGRHALEDVLFHSDAKLAAWIDKKLTDLGESERRDQCIERILARPRANPDLFAWAARRLGDGAYKHLAEHIPLLSVCEQCLEVIDELQTALDRDNGVDPHAAAAAMARLRGLLMDGQNKYVKAALERADIESARKFYGQIQMSSGLSNQLRTALENLVLRAHPELRKGVQKPSEDTGPKFHYALAESIEAKRSELSRILNEIIPELSVRISEARALGDLKENAEYHAAKDRQRLAMQQANELDEQISRARPVDLGSVRPTEVRFGTRVVLRNLATGEERSQILLGMWEADNDKGIISYLTPFGMQLMGRKPGEQFTVVLPDGTTTEYEIAAVEAAAAPA